MRAIFIFLLFVVGAVQPAASQDIDFDALEAELAGDGLEGWIHGAVHHRGMYVFTWRSPDNFFLNAQFPLRAMSEDVEEALAELHRHDKIKIKGGFITNGAPLRHIFVTNLEVVELWEGNRDREEYPYEFEIPEDLESRTSLVGKVHAIADEGRVLVIEFGDQIIPVLATDTSVSSTLYRNDKIRLHFEIRSAPSRPAHLVLRSDVDQPIEVLERLTDRHGEVVEMEGELVMFPQSPQIAFNVFALRITDADHVSRNYTLVNFDDFDVFTAVRNRIQATWDANESTAAIGRNYLVNPHIRIVARGRFNQVSPNQANPQILFAADDDIELTVLP